MPVLYEISDINTKNTNECIKKVDILFDLTGEKYILNDTNFCKQLMCVKGSCDIKLQNGKDIEYVTLNNPLSTLKIDKNIGIELSKYNSDTKISIQYLDTDC